MTGAPHLRLFIGHLRRNKCPFAPQSCTLLCPFQIRIFVKLQHIWTFYIICLPLPFARLPCSPRGGGSRTLNRICFFQMVHMSVLAWYLYPTQRIYLSLVICDDWYFLHKSNRKPSFSFSVLDCGAEFWTSQQTLYIVHPRSFWYYSFYKGDLYFFIRYERKSKYHDKPFSNVTLSIFIIIAKSQRLDLPPPRLTKVETTTF